MNDDRDLIIRDLEKAQAELETEAAAIRQGLQFVVTNLEEAGEDFGEIDAAVIGGMAKSALSSTAGANLQKERTEDKARIGELGQERDNWIETARQYALNSDYYRGLVVKVGEMLGPEVYVSDDGSVHLDVLCAKVPEMVVALKAEAEKVKEDLRFANNELVLADKQNEELLAERDRLEAEAAAYRQALELTEGVLPFLNPVESLAFAHGYRYTDAQVAEIKNAKQARVDALSGTAGKDLARWVEEAKAFVKYIALPDEALNDHWHRHMYVPIEREDGASFGLIQRARRLLGLNEETGEERG